MASFRKKTPEELLLSIAKLHQGRLKILVGSVSGSGKTYHMLREGLQLKQEGIDVVLCALPMPQSEETIALAAPFEQAALNVETLAARNPEAVLIDGLAYLNEHGAGFRTRLEEVLFLIGRGISVVTTINVYELEGIDEEAFRWTGVRPLATVPANTLELADEVRLIDVSPETMLQRFEEGRLKGRPEPAIAQRGNLAVLRELALRLVAEGVNESLEKHREELGLSGPSGASERILVTAQYHWNGSLYVRRGEQIARRLGGDVVVVSFMSPHRKLTKDEQAFKASIKKLAIKVGGSFEELPLPNRRGLSAELASYAEEQHVTRIVMGHSKQSRWQQFKQGSVALGLLRRLKQVDLFLMADRAEHEGERILPVKHRRDAAKGLFRRVSPDQREQQAKSIRRGHFHLFIGAAPGVGKTYRMLAEANLLLQKGVDVVIGLVETHGREETKRQIGELPVVPRQVISYLGTKLEEMDVEAIIRRNPDVVLVDELAHTNMPGSVRKKRYEDVIHLMDSGISVISTMNVQHIESLNDAIEQITGIRVRETVPDAIIRSANQVELIDVTPQMLQQRMREGKIYDPNKVEQALSAFFTTGNLIALRELALRELADDVDERLESWDRNQSLRGPLRRKEVIFVGIELQEDAERLIRRGFRIANRLKAQWHVHHVQSGHSADADSINKLKHLTERLGGLFELSHAESRGDIAGTLLTAAKRAKATQLIVGQPRGSGWQARRTGFIVPKLLQGARHMDLLIVARRMAACYH
ncbi:two-component system sensor histidine kinase KdpD [Paenibacillus endophyticus]|uniref:Two-component system sensor histidine kinase KdpD n=1 Tax=Paenibacillus endophyticus TaxID=1294268 RepID=A0A7W5GC96_9BACL|nr:histidine kinase [Paenibacillus endophyticus]MBB3154253.1 two-component system sensor histidine kinase KdpD [Paenibacillus endophyticus]